MGNGIRARRRNSAKYVWAVYTIIKGIDENAGGTSGSVALLSTNQNYASSTYTVGSNGTITLTNATKKTASELLVGEYITDISTSGAATTTGTTLYKITQNASSSTFSRTISYIAYTPKNMRGTDTGDRIKSKTLDYPENGIQGDYWYVLL